MSSTWSSWRWCSSRMAFHSSGSDWARRSGESIGKFYRYPSAMIDRAALEQVASRQLAAMQSPSGVSLVLRLHGGGRYTVQGFDEFMDPYRVVRVYPGDDELKDELPRDATGA